MFGNFYKKQKEAEKDPEKALDNADKSLNKGFTGFATKAFLGKDFVNDMNKTMEMGRDAVEMQKQYQNPEQFGLDGTAVVVSIQDTGKLINYNPVVIMQLKVQPQYEPAFETTTETMVSKIAIPRVGDTVKIKYAPADHTKILVLS
jgi:hypothetical protein